MMKLIKKTLLLIVLLSSLVAACSRRVGGPLGADADPSDLPAITGEFALNGLDANGSEYGGRLTIVEVGPGVYGLQWLVFESIQEGTGTLVGNRLEVRWATVEGFPNPMSGTASYTVTVNGELYGTKSIDGFPGEASETAYPNSPENMSE